MNKSDLIARVAHVLSVNNQESERVVNIILGEIKSGVEESGRMTLTGFGSFDTRQRKERPGRNPQTGEAIHIPPSKTVGFRPSKSWKESINDVAETQSEANLN
jgi:DNA-binding protein HU-beta